MPCVKQCCCNDTTVKDAAKPALIIVLGQISRVYVEVVVSVYLPELAVDDIKMFIGEVLCQLVDVLFIF